MLDLALAGCAHINELQTAALAEPYPGELPTAKVARP
jgi:ribonuclease PH